MLPDRATAIGLDGPTLVGLDGGASFAASPNRLSLRAVVGVDVSHVVFFSRADVVRVPRGELPPLRIIRICPGGIARGKGNCGKGIELEESVRAGARRRQ